MSTKASINSAHQPGHTSLVFSRDGSRIYTGGSDALVRIWRTDLGTDQEPDIALDACEAVTSVAAGNDCWLSGSADSEVRRYGKGKPDLEGLVTSFPGVSVYCVAVDPKGSRVAASSEEPIIKVVDLQNTSNVSLLKGHTKAVRRVTWHPSGSLLTSCGADGKIIVWDLSGKEPTQVQTIDGVIPAVADTESPEFLHDCSAMWHTSGQYFFVATRAHEIVTISRSDWRKIYTYSDEASSGAITAMALSTNGVYLATASKSGLCIWSTQNRRMLYKFQGALSAPITQMAWSPSLSLLAWTDTDGVLTRWGDPLPPDAISPIKPIASTVAAPLPAPTRRKGTPTLFDLDADEELGASASRDIEMDLGGEGAGDDVDLDNDIDDWVVDDLGGGMRDDDEKKWAAREGVKEMVSVTKAQPAFQPGSTPMENKKRYLAYNMIGVIEVTDQDTHHVVNVEFHDRSARKGYHFTDHFKYDLAALGERGAVYACQPEGEHPAQVNYKPYGNWSSQAEWTYELPKGTRVLGVTAGGSPPTKSLRERADVDIQGNGNVVIATSDHELIFLTGGGVERYVMSMQGDFVTMVASAEWVFVVEREGSTTMDGSQNLTGRLVKFEDYCLLQKDALPVSKGQTLKWVGATEEGAPAIYDSAGVLHALPRFRIPFSATWTRILNTNTLDRREGKDESYWPVGVSGEMFMCLILKGRQEHPGFPRPLIQELQLRLPFKRIYPIGAPSEEHLARENLFLDILRDGLGDELTTDEISKKELELDKEIIQLIQSACKTDQLARAMDLAKLLHHTASFDMAIKLAGFYHLIGLQEKFEALKEDREDVDRLETAREKQCPIADCCPHPDPKAVPGLQPTTRCTTTPVLSATPAPAYRPPTRPRREVDLPSRMPDSDDFQSSAATVDWDLESSAFDMTQDGKRKRSEEPGSDTENDIKRRALEDAGLSRSAIGQPKSNPFARKAGVDNNRNPFAKGADNRNLRKSDSFFNKVAAAESEKPKRSALGKNKSKDKEKEKEKDKKVTGKQMKLQFGKRAGGERATDDSQTTATTDLEESQETEETVAATQIEEASQRPREVDDPIIDDDQPMDDGSPEPIDWPASPERGSQVLPEVSEM
ncbi:hypothetical protein NM688_g4769 [Phlebia brevispora]|uniref:Uncharacterized protein n=1 Tax=Phlebia brevispora TaxID=194682 RepID=A0ACC1T209_9APHY|nr:hypothetical protein NM688_g4769 [Phlebia brevispora]